MTMKRVIFAVLVALFVASCSKFDQQDALPEVEYGQLRACFAEQTRTYVEGERFLRWHERDELSVFYGNAINNKYRFNGKTGDSESSARFFYIQCRGCYHQHTGGRGCSFG